MKLQFTLFDRNGKYKPISTLIDIEDMKDFENNKKKYIQKAILKIRKQKGDIELKTLLQQGYVNYKVREYNKEEIEKQNKINRLKKMYENRKIKKEKKIDENIG